MAAETKLRRMWHWVKSLYDVRPTGSDDLEPPSILQLRANFANREAIYIEQGALRVRVTDIHVVPTERVVWTEAWEVPAPGLGVGLFDSRERRKAAPLHFEVSGGLLTKFCDSRWENGYGAWSLYFDPRVVQGVLELASRFPVEMETYERYDQILHFLRPELMRPDLNWQKVFPDA